MTTNFKLVVGGEVQAGNGTYLNRQVDDELYKACLAGEFSYVLSSRQIGKSSLKNAIAERLLRDGARVARIDLNSIGKSVSNTDTWFKNFLYLLISQLRLNIDIQKWWKGQGKKSPSLKFIEFLKSVVLETYKESIVIFVDEIDVTLGLAFTDDFFAAIRVIYNERSQYESYNRLTFILIGSATPDDLIKDNTRTPFNIGKPINIEDFTEDEVIPFRQVLEQRCPGMGREILENIYQWTSGHPFLTQKICNAVISTKGEIDDHIVEKLVLKIFIDQDLREEDHLIFIQKKILKDQNVISILRVYEQIVSGKTVLNDRESVAINRLKLYGLVAIEGGRLRIRNRIYESFFDIQWATRHLNQAINRIGIAADESKPQDGRITKLTRESALGIYLSNLIATHQHLRLQGIRAGSQPLSVSLEKVYVSLNTLDKHGSQEVQSAVTKEIEDIEVQQGRSISLSKTLLRYHRLVIVGDPGCGKTTLLSYLTLTYARALRDGQDLVRQRLGVYEAGNLPILLPLRDLGRNLLEGHPNLGKDGPVFLLNYLHEYYRSQEIGLPNDFFSTFLEEGKAILLLDGMDEVAQPALRQRIARLIEKFSERYPKCRFIVTSRQVGYEGASRIGAEFGLAKILDFSPAEVRQFVRDWMRVVESSLAGSDAPEILRLADKQSEQLINSIDTNPRVADLAVNPLLLTVIALVHRYRAQLPERRSELYEEAVEVLLGHWDAAKGMETELLLAGGRMLDSGDRRSLLEPVAFWLHEHKKRELERDDLRAILLPKFMNMTAGDKEQAAKSLNVFLSLINERSGLLIERGVGVYGFSHLTFQEYLAARVLAERDDALKYSLKVLPDIWWREVILLEAGYLSNQGSRRVSALIRAILDADPRTEPEPHHHLLLAAECLFDVGPARVEGDLLGEARRRLKKQADASFKKGNKVLVLDKITASNALARLDSGEVVAYFWKPPYGEPEWISIPAGEFWMGENKSKYDNERPQHILTLPEYKIARVPVTNAQYTLYVQDAKANSPEHWRGGDVPPGLENHPVVNVSWYDALAYCKWLGEKIRKPVTLPNEAEWEKAARGDKDKRNYPWGNDWRELDCNSEELGMNETTPVGLFLNGASPYGVLDMSGNVWEWTRNLALNYPYETNDRNINLSASDYRAIRGGSFGNNRVSTRCSARMVNNPENFNKNIGFRIVLSPVLSS